MISNINSTALNVYSDKLGVHAENIANASNENYKSTDVNVENRSNGDQLALKLQKNDYGTDLNEDIPALDETKNIYTAQLRVLKVRDDLIGETIDLLA